MKNILIILLFFPLIGGELSESHKRSFDKMADISDILDHVRSLDNDLLEIGDEDTAGPEYVNGAENTILDPLDADCWIDSINRQPLDLGVTHTASKKQRQKSKKSCSECGRSVFNLETHMRIHTGERPYKCKHPGCDYAAIQLSNIQVHERTHTGEKLFKCAYEGCGYASSWKKNLVCHIRTHTGERPYKCEHSECVYETSYKRDLNRHTRTHNKILCVICNKMIGDLYAHSKAKEHKMNAVAFAVTAHQEDEG